MDNIDSWKNKSVFEQQLARNLFELNGNYPKHWEILVNFLEPIYKECPNCYIVDIGCGCGALASVIKSNFPRMRYTGFDYSEEAIELARKQWWQIRQDGASFCVQDYKNICSKSLRGVQILHQSALCDVLPNGNECFDHLLSLNVPIVISQKMKIVEGLSFAEEYSVYGIDTYEYYHSNKDVMDSIEKYDYTIEQRVNSIVGTSFLLNKV